MGVIRQGVRNIRFGSEIHSIMAVGESLMFQNVMSCSTNKGKYWYSAVVGLTNKRLLIEWQKKKGKDVAISYEQILSWKISDKIGGISGLFSKGLVCVDICINDNFSVRIMGHKSVTEIFINQLKELCMDKMNEADI